METTSNSGNEQVKEFNFPPIMQQFWKFVGSELIGTRVNPNKKYFMSERGYQALIDNHELPSRFGPINGKILHRTGIWFEIVKTDEYDFKSENIEQNDNGGN